MIRLSPTPRPPTHEPLLQRAWRRRTARSPPSDGEIVLDGDTGVPLSVQASPARSRFQREGRKAFEMKLEVTRTLVAMGQQPRSPPRRPADVVATPERAREVDDRDYLLQGIAPPLRKQDASATKPDAKPAGYVRLGQR